MKKLLIILIGGLFLPFMVYADMGAPENLEYNVEVTSSSGITSYDYQCTSDNCVLKKVGTIPKGENFTIYYEMEINGEYYGDVKYNGEYVYIKISDTTITTKEITLDDEKSYKLEEPKSLTVLTDKLEIHSSPAYAFKVVGTITAGEKITVKGGYGDTWYYIEYDGIKGWIDSYSGTVGTYNKEKILVITEHDLVDENQNIIGTIPANTILDDYYSLDAWSWSYYVEYNGQKGYVDFDNIAKKEKAKLKLFKEVEAFENFEDAYKCVYEENCENSIKIAKDTELTSTYYYRLSRGAGNIPYYQVKYNNKEYWIYENYFNATDDSSIFDTNYIAEIVNEKIKVNEEIKMYAELDNLVEARYSTTAIEPTSTISKGENIKVLYYLGTYFYVEKEDGTQGWIEYDEYYEEYISKKPTEEVEEPNAEEDKDIKVEEKGLSKEELLYICIGGAIVLTLTVIVILVIISKKSKAKKEQNI